MKLIGTSQVIIRLAAIVIAVEFLIMLILGLFPEFEKYPYLAAISDTFLLTVFTTPIIYHWVIKPFVLARDDALAKFRHLADTDPLTQLPNRRFLTRYLEKMIASNTRHQVNGALLMIDLDEFKNINDILGHDAGDTVLVEFAKNLQFAVRKEDVAARVGGDEFVVIINNLDNNKKIACDQALTIAKKITDLAGKIVNFPGHDYLQAGASIGIRMIGIDDNNSDTIVIQADKAMYRAKQTGGGQAAIFLQNNENSNEIASTSKTQLLKT